MERSLTSADEAPSARDTGGAAELAYLRGRVARLQDELARLRSEPQDATDGLVTLALSGADVRRAEVLYDLGALAMEQEDDPDMPFAASLAALITEAIDAAWDLAHHDEVERADGDPPPATAIRARARDGRRTSASSAD